jgi:hypothetical protein
MTKHYPGVIDVYAKMKAKLGAAGAERYKGRFKIVFRANGKQVWQTLRDSTARKANLVRNDKMSAVRHGEFADTGRKLTLIAWLRSWMETVKLNRR